MAQATNNYGSAALPYQHRADQRQCDGGGEQQSHTHVALYAAHGVVYTARVTVFAPSDSTYAGARCFPAATR